MGIKISLPVSGPEAPAGEPQAHESTAPQPSQSPKTRAQGGTVLDEIDHEVKSNRIMLYMKGLPQQPMCGFSARAVQILNMVGKPYGAVDILSDPEKRQAIKEYSDWPTIPQIYVGGEFVGGCDILTELYQSGELQQMVDKAFADGR